ncbi:MAG: metallophosphoesterase [Spirochaetaceae bacterium]
MTYKKVAQITDLHIDKKELMPFNTNGKDNLIRIFEDIKKQGIEHLFITGDICLEFPKIYIYEWLKERLEKYNFSYDIIPGNHDNVSMINQIFDLGDTYKDGQIFFTLPSEDYKLIFMDTCPNMLSKKQQSWFKDEVKKSEKPIIVFMHHPPTFLGHNFMDSNFPLQNIDEVQGTFQSVEKELTIFCGHYHADIHIKYKNQNIYLTPSTLFQIDDKEEDFIVSSYIPGWRLIEFKKNSLFTVVKHVNIERD